MARTRSAARSLTRPRAAAATPTPSASDQIEAANAKFAAAKTSTAAQRRARRGEGPVDPSLLSPGERLIARQQQEILQRQGIIQGQNAQILARLDHFSQVLNVEFDVDTATVVEAIRSRAEDGAPESEAVSPEADTVELEADPSLLNTSAGDDESSESSEGATDDDAPSVA